VKSAASTSVRGAHAEQLAADYLIDHGYRIVERNWRKNGGELDIIAYDGDVLCFVEVRSRDSDDFGDPLETIDQRKIRRIVRTARAYLATIRGPWPDMRFDAVGVLMSNPPRIELVKDAFEAP
jgi:putative endonuclease